MQIFTKIKSSTEKCAAFILEKLFLFGYIPDKYRSASSAALQPLAAAVIA